VLTLQNLEAVGMLKVQGARNSFAVVRKSLKLIVDDVNEQVHSRLLSLGYVHNVYLLSLWAVADLNRELYKLE
jgi:hypothetical protein